MLANTLPELQAAERRLRELARSRYGIEYTINEGHPDFAGLRTPDTTALLLKWRDEAVAAARKTAEAKRRAQGGTAVQVKAAGDVAAQAAHYRVSPFNVGKHGVGAAFDVRIVKVGTSPGVVAARAGGEKARADKGGTAVQVKAARDVAASRKAYELLGGLAPECGLKWGGMFKDNPATPVVEQPDPYHFELPDARDVLVKRYAAARSSGAIAIASPSTSSRPGRSRAGVLVAVVIIGLLAWWGSR